MHMYDEKSQVRIINELEINVIEIIKKKNR